MVERTGFLVKISVGLLEHPPVPDSGFWGKGPVPVREDDHVVPEKPPRLENELFAAALDGVRVPAHTAADLELDRAGADLVDALRQDLDLFVRGGVAVAAGAVVVDGVAAAGAEQIRHRPARGLAEQVDDARLDPGDAAPVGQALDLVVEVLDIDALQGVLEVARVGPDEVRRDLLRQDRMEIPPVAAGDRDALDPAGRAGDDVGERLAPDHADRLDGQRPGDAGRQQDTGVLRGLELLAGDRSAGGKVGVDAVHAVPSLIPCRAGKASRWRSARRRPADAARTARAGPR